MYNYKLFLLLISAFLLAPSSFGYSFSDDFEDDDISDWEERVVDGNWSVSNGMVHGNTPTHPCELVASEGIPVMNGEITISVGGIHGFGICSRLDENDNAVIAYVSPDHDVARIRLIENGTQGTILNSLNYNFPSGVEYQLTLTLQDGDVDFLIEVPSSGDSWTFSATDPNPRSGMYGFHMGEEPGASWDWIEVQGDAVGEAELTWLITDDQTVGNGNFCLQPGETISLSLEITNSSDFEITNAFGILQSLNSDLEVVQNYVDYGDIPGMSSSYGNSSFSVFAPFETPQNDVYNMRMTLMADGGYQELINFGLPVGCGLATDLESDSFGWTAGSAASGWANNWHVSSTRNHTPGGQYSFKCGSTGSGDYSDHHYGYLETPYFNIPLEGECTFWSWIESQILSSSIALDGGIVQYRRLDEWIDLFPIPPYTYQIASGTTGPFPSGTMLYSGTVDWSEYSILFPDSLAGPGALRFVFGSDDAGNREGWYIDDFLVTGPGSASGSTSGAVNQPFLAVSDNPVLDAVTFSFVLPGSNASSIEIRDVTGRIIRELPAVPLQTVNSIVWETGSIPAGIYFAGISGSDMKPLKLIKL